MAAAAPQSAAASASPSAAASVPGVVLLGAIMSILDTTVINVAIDRLRSTSTPR
jgi:hypothetical protein